MLDRIEFLFGEAFQAIRRNVLMTLAAVTTVAVALFLIGGFGAIYFQATRYAARMPSQFEMRVYLRDDASASSKEALKHDLTQLVGISKVTFLSKEVAWAGMRASHPEIPADLTNPLPDGYALNFKDLAAADSAAILLRDRPEIEKVLYQKQLLDVLRQGLSILRYIGYFGFVLLAIGGIIIYNAIRLTVVARRTEIRIMRLVGAAHLTVRLPFMIEGFFHGVIGGGLAFVGLEVLYRQVTQYMSVHGLQYPTLPHEMLAIIVTGLGAALGLVCSTIAVRAPLRMN